MLNKFLVVGEPAKGYGPRFLVIDREDHDQATAAAIRRGMAPESIIHVSVVTSKAHAIDVIQSLFFI